MSSSSVTTFTPVQSRVVHYKGKALVVKSRAGTGKTTMLRGYAEANLTIPMLYICYNKSISEEAQKKFPSNVTCRTMHAIAYARKGVLYKHKLTGNLRLTDVKNFLNIHCWETTKQVINTLNNYLSSASTHIGVEHTASSTPKHTRPALCELATKLWNACIDPAHEMQITHDMYLKLYCLEPADLHRWFAVILFDEAQDSNPVVSDYLYRQQCSHIVVGDEHQQLYRWRGANNSMADFIKTKDADVIVVDTSFRFGATIAKVASTLLAYKSKITKGELSCVYGNESINDTVSDLMPRALQRERYTKLHRTVAGTIKTALENIDRRLYWVGGIGAYNLQELLDVYYFSVNQTTKIKRTKLKSDYKNYAEYKLAAKSTEDLEMSRIVRMIDEHGASLERKIKLLQANAVTTEDRAELVISTAHRSKGLEWPVVELADDFPDLLDNKKNRFDLEGLADELNLLYVACTRAIRHLTLNTLVMSLDKVVHGKQSTYITRSEFKPGEKAPSETAPSSGTITRFSVPANGPKHSVTLNKD